MRSTPARPHTAVALALLLLLTALPAAARLDLPVWTPGSDVAAPFYRGDVLELQLRPSAARAAHPRGAGPTRARPVGRLGVAGVDAVAGQVGALAFEPEFQGHVPPGEGEGPDLTAFHLVHLAPGADLERALASFAALPEVVSAQPIAVLPVSALPNDSLTFATFWLYKDQPVRTDIRAPEAWEVTTGDTGIVVAVLDTGILPWHPDLGGREGERGQMWANWAERAGLPGVDDDGNGFVDDVAGWDFVANGTQPGAGEDATVEDNDPNDWGGHGTAVAGIVGATAGNGIGLAGVVPDVRIMSLRMGWYCNTCGVLPSGRVDMSYAARAIDYATRMGASVLNCSWQSQNLAGIDTALAIAARRGVVVVNAAGNFGTPFTYLGQREEVISVAATDSNDVVWQNSVVGPWVDLSAAGVSMTTTMIQRAHPTDPIQGRLPIYRSFINGTSFSAPQVAGAVALLQARRRELGRDPLSPMGTLLRLRETTDDIRALNPIVTGFGTGRLNLLRALSEPERSLAVRAHARSVGPPVVIQYNTGRSLVVYAMSDRTLVGYDGATGDTAWVRPIPGPPTGSLAAAELGAARGVLLAGATTTGIVYALYDDGRSVPGWPRTAQPGLNLTAGVALADVTGDGLAEVIAGGTAISGSNVWAWHSDGTLVAGFPFATGTLGLSPAALADMDGEPGAEIVFADGNGFLRAVRGDGSELPGFPAGPFNAPFAPVVARLGGTATPPSVLVASTGQLSAIAADGSPGFSVPLAGLTAQDPALADLDGDGVDEILVATSSPHAIEVRDALGAPFTARPGWPKALPSPAQGPLLVGPVAAAHGPGVVFFRTGGLMALDDSANVLASFPKPGGAGLVATLAELDGDGASELAAGASITPLASSGSFADTSVYTYDAGPGTWSAALAHWPTPRGDAGRTASHAGGTPGPLVVDRIRPAMVTSLEAQALGPMSLSVSYTVTGDDSLTGTATRVVLRRAAQPLDESNFDTGTPVPTPPPGPPGTVETLTVASLPEGSTWWFAVRVEDDAGNASALSPPDSAALPGLVPGAITDLRVLSVAESTVVLAWTATGENGNVGRPQEYLVSGSTEPLDAGNVDDAPLEVRRPALYDAGAGETTAVMRLTPGRRWRFAVRGVDATQAMGPISNVVEVVTPVGGAIAGRTGVAVGPRPNPSAGDVVLDWQGDASRTGPQWLQVHDASGRLRRRIELGSEPGGSYTWDGRDGDRRLLPAGLYFVRLVSGSHHADARVVFIR